MAAKKISIFFFLSKQAQAGEQTEDVASRSKFYVSHILGKTCWNLDKTKQKENT